MTGTQPRVAKPAAKGATAPRGNLVPDTHIVALMLDHGIRTIWTHDGDYRRFQSIDVRDPFE